MIWTSADPNVGNGRPEITVSLPNERVESALDFSEMGTAQATMALAADGAQTRVAWGLILGHRDEPGRPVCGTDVGALG